MSAKVLVIDDEPGIRDLLTRELTAEGHVVDAAADGMEALKMMEHQRYQVALCDINMPKLGGLEALEGILKRDADIEVIMMTGYATVETAVEAMKKGAYDFVQKPFNLNEVLMLVQKSIEKSNLRSVVHQLRQAKMKLEETQLQLVQSEKLAGIGQLAAGVAHELNNPMSGIMGFAQLMLEDATLSPQQKSDVETIYAQSNRCKVIIQNLLQFCRRKDRQPEPLDIIPLLQTTLNLIQYEYSTSGIDIIQKLPPSLPPVVVDSGQIQQVFLNLITNARQAMETQKTGRITIDGESRNGTVILRFTDTGPGIPTDVQAKIFDPFFTTKPPGKGTGLGLSICYGIVQSHHGKLTVQSTPGQGAAFTVELPIAAAPEVN